MIRKNLLLLLFCLFISSCGPIDIFVRNIELSNVEIIVDQKEKFEVGDSVDFKMTFDADFDTFNSYDFKMSIYQNSNPIIDAIQITDEDGKRWDNTKLSFDSDSNTADGKVFAEYKIKFVESGQFQLSIFLLGRMKKQTNDRYIYRKHYNFIVKEKKLSVSKKSTEE